MRLLENTWLPRVTSWVQYALIARYFQHDGISRVLFPNRRMDKYSNWLMCWSRAIFTLQHLPLSSQKKVQQLLGSPPTDDLIYPHGCIAWALRSTWTSYRKPQPESVRGGGKTAARRPFSKSDPSTEAGAVPSFLHILKAWCFRSH